MVELIADEVVPRLALGKLDLNDYNGIIVSVVRDRHDWYAMRRLRRMRTKLHWFFVWREMERVNTSEPTCIAAQALLRRLNRQKWGES